MSGGEFVSSSVEKGCRVEVFKLSLAVSKLMETVVPRVCVTHISTGLVVSVVHVPTEIPDAYFLKTDHPYYVSGLASYAVSTNSQYYMKVIAFKILAAKLAKYHHLKEEAGEPIEDCEIVRTYKSAEAVERSDGTGFIETKAVEEIRKSSRKDENT